MPSVKGNVHVSAAKVRRMCACELFDLVRCRGQQCSLFNDHPCRPTPSHPQYILESQWQEMTISSSESVGTSPVDKSQPRWQQAYSNLVVSAWIGILSPQTKDDHGSFETLFDRFSVVVNNAKTPLSIARRYLIGARPARSCQQGRPFRSNPLASASSRSELGLSQLGPSRRRPP